MLLCQVGRGEVWVKVVRNSGHMIMFAVYYNLYIIRRVVNGAAIVTSIICILLLISLDYVNSLLRKYVKKVPIHIPAQLIVVSECTIYTDSSSTFLRT